MNTSDFLTTDYLVSQIVVMTGDENLRSGLSRGWYTDKISDALSEINFDSKFNEETCDIYNWNSKGKYYVTLPSGCFSVKDIFVWNGDKDTIESSQRIHYKRGFNNVNHTSGYTSKVKDTASDQTLDPIYQREVVSENLIYGNLYNGQLQLSKSCDGWDNIRIIYYGVPFDVGVIPAIPVYLKEFVIDFVTEMFFRAKKVKDKSLMNDWKIAYTMLYGDQKNVGSKKRAERRIKEISKWEQDSLQEYWSRAQHIYS